MEALYNELNQRGIVEFKELEDGQECYDLSIYPNLSTIVTKKLANAKYVSVEEQKDPDSNELVFSLIFYDETEEQVGGCDLTKTKIYWDDDNEA